MADETDIASERETFDRDLAVRAARTSVPDGMRQGPARCSRCHGPNDRRHDGFALCSDCMEA